MLVPTYAVFQIGHCGAITFAWNAGYSSLAQMQAELCITDEQIEGHYFEIDQWPMPERPSLSKKEYTTIKAWMIFGSPSRAYEGECKAQIKDALALVDEVEYENLL